MCNPPEHGVEKLKKLRTGGSAGDLRGATGLCERKRFPDGRASVANLPGGSTVTSGVVKKNQETGVVSQATRGESTGKQTDGSDSLVVSLDF